MRGIDDGRGDPDSGARRGTCHDMRAPGDLCRCDGHDGAGDMAVAPAGHIATRRLDRDTFLPRDQAGNDFDLDVLQRRFLGLGKTAHIGVAELDIALYLVGNQRRRGSYLFLREDDAAVVSVEFRGVIQGGPVAACLDIPQNGLNDFVDIRSIAFGRECRFFQIF